MTNNIESENSNNAADPARKLLAVLGSVGGMMEALFQQQSSMSSDERVENLEQYFVAGYFKPLGDFYKCFFDCLDAVGRVDVFDSGVCAEIQQRLNGFWTVFVWYLDDIDMATKFHLLVEELLDLSKKILPYKEGAEKQKQLHDKAKSVFERVCQQARKIELSLDFPSQPVPNNVMEYLDGMVGNDAPSGTSNGFTPDDRRRLRRIERAAVFSDTTPEARHVAEVRRQQAKYGATLYRPTTKYENGFSFIRAAKAAIDHDKFRNARGAYSASETHSLAQAIRRLVQSARSHAVD